MQFLDVSVKVSERRDRIVGEVYDSVTHNIQFIM